jgi:hypothetical protein
VTDIERQVDETAFAMLHLSPEQRDRCFMEAFNEAIARHPEVDYVPPLVVAYVAAVEKRIAELKQLPEGTA